ncbi:MAG TPA: HNH endonuclease signature motif containing protein [Mycobacteriales bacterium]|nr:HNH endonuclease signature motif containing protein [Mycobacteriales bacterium]
MTAHAPRLCGCRTRGTATRPLTDEDREFQYRLPAVLSSVRCHLIAGPVGSDCWDGTNTTSSGYSVAAHRGRTMKLHLVTFRLLIGPVPAGLEVDHLCARRSCANVAHLEAVGRLENVGRATARRHGRACERLLHLPPRLVGGAWRCDQCIDELAEWRARPVPIDTTGAEQLQLAL